MGAGLSAEHILNGVGAIFGDSPALFMVQFDNGFLVYFHPTKVRVGNGDVGLTAYAPRGPHGGMEMSQNLGASGPLALENQDPKIVKIALAAWNVRQKFYRDRIEKVSAAITSASRAIRGNLP